MELEQSTGAVAASRPCEAVMPKSNLDRFEDTNLGDIASLGQRERLGFQ